jgi:hypothetical protein
VLPLAGVAATGVVIGVHADLVGPKDLGILPFRLFFDGWVGLLSPLKVRPVVPILWGVMPVFTFADREASHAPGGNL